MMTDRQRCEQRDVLTGTATPGAMRRFVEAALDLSEPHGPRVALFAIGIDGLGRIAAEDGAAQAEAVLLGAADRLRGGLRSHDLIGRLPEGFAVCVSEIFSAQACKAAERLKRLLEASPVPTARGPVALRCSLGLAFGQGPGSSAEALIDRALAALAAAQAAGGGCIMLDG